MATTHLTNGHAKAACTNGHCCSSQTQNGYATTNGHSAESTPTKQVSTHNECQNTVNYLHSRIGNRSPTLGLVCGSGFGSIAQRISDSVTIDYADIPGFLVSSVAGHSGCLVFGQLCGQEIVCMQGRVHPYEGHKLQQCVYPIRVMALLGVKTLLLTNAAGGVNPDYNVGDIMIISDHIFLPGFVGGSPLVGPNDERFGPRFPACLDMYDAKLRSIARQAAKKLNAESFLREGVYTMALGPQYETAAEARFLRVIGTDAAGMSTCHEALTAKHCGLKIFGLSLITNKVVTDANIVTGPSHEEVLLVGKQRAQIATALLEEVIKQMNNE